MAQQIPISPDAVIDPQHTIHEVADGVAYRRLALVNVVFLGAPGAPDREWVLVDTGIPGSRSAIVSSASERFGKGSRPGAIVLTHGHFDHVGALVSLAEEWEAPVYAHLAEHRYLDGQDAYPPPDPTVGGGVMAALSPLFPTSPVDVSRSLHAVGADGRLPVLPEWRVIETPGHSPGHISLWRESDRTLVAGDAVITTAQESAYAVLTQEPELHGPPQYFTPDWDAAERSVQKLVQLRPERIVSGHGPALAGEEFRQSLALLARDFRTVAIPAHGRYVPDHSGVSA